MISTIVSNWGQLSFWELLFMFVSYTLIILVALPVHELAHAYSAYRMGDSTAKWNGRLTMDPFAHLDPIGTLMIFLFGFGYAKPVPVNPRNFRNYRLGNVVVSLAGPLSNLAMGFVTFALLRISMLFSLSGVAYDIVSIFLYSFGRVNIMLAVFNLLPIPPLDGYHIIEGLLPSRWQYYMARYQMYFSFGVLLLIATGALGTPLYYAVDFIVNVFRKILGM